MHNITIIKNIPRLDRKNTILKKKACIIKWMIEKCTFPCDRTEMMLVTDTLHKETHNYTENVLIYYYLPYCTKNVPNYYYLHY